jgi:hypothetical protein
MEGKGGEMERGSLQKARNDRLVLDWFAHVLLTEYWLHETEDGRACYEHDYLRCVRCQAAKTHGARALRCHSMWFCALCAKAWAKCADNVSLADLRWTLSSPRNVLTRQRHGLEQKMQQLLPVTSPLAGTFHPTNG